MALDPSLPLRQAIVTLLKATPELIALLPADQVHGEQPPANPAFPFTRYGVTESTSREVRFPIHSFSRADFTDEVAAINAAVADALDGRRIDLTEGMHTYLRWVGSTILPDAAEASAYHGIVRFVATVPRC